MSNTWTEQAIQNLVPDAGSLRDGQKLARAQSWKSIGRNQQAAWGLLQGSGASPYQACIDLEDMASKCSCPSRKFPCKHGVALMLLIARDEIPSENAPDWVTAWLENRQRKKEAAAAPPSDDSAPPKKTDPAKQAKTEAARLAKVGAGIEELRLFLEDTARQGLGDPRIKTYEFWDRIAGRMVDAQMSPIANRLRELGGKPFQKKHDWTSAIAEELGALYALTEAYLRRDSLSEGLAADVQTALGFTVKQDEIIASQPAVSDRWQVVGVLTTQEDKLIERRTWLYGENTQRYALILDFAHSSRPFTTSYAVGQQFFGEVVYYPSAYPQRAAVKAMHSGYSAISLSAEHWSESVDSVLDSYAEALAANPFIERVPVGLRRIYVTPTWVTDPDAKRLIVYPSGQTAEWYKAVVGDHRLPVFGEWDGTRFNLSSVLTEEGWLCLTQL